MVFDPRRATLNKVKKQVRGPVLASLTVLALLLVLGGANKAIGQTTSWHVVQASDGTLYVLIGGSRYTLQADPISDDDLADVPDAGPLGPFLTSPPPAPSDTTTPADFSVSPSPEASASPAPEQEAPSTPSPTGAGAAGPSPSGPAIPAVATPRPGVVGSPAAPGGASPALASPTAAAGGLVNPSGVEAPVLLSGSGTQPTRSFSLRGGSYNALWTATTNSGTADTFAAFLRPADPANQHAPVIATVLVPGGRSASGQVQLATLPAGTYSVDVVGGTTSWSLSLSAQASPGSGR